MIMLLSDISIPAGDESSIEPEEEKETEADIDE